MKKIAVIGVGNMGSALIRGLILSKKAMPDMINIFDIDPNKTQALLNQYGIKSASHIGRLIETDTAALILAVKPQTLGQVLDSIADRINENLIVISIAAGISTNFILSRVGPTARVIRAMPNAAAMAGAGATAICKAGRADDNDLATALDLFSAVGTVEVVEEKMMNVITALSGSGPAYFFLILEALVDGAVRLGLDRSTARSLAIQTMAGAAKMALDGETSFCELKDRITSPGGTTMAGLYILERYGLRGILMEAVDAATSRAQELDKSES